MPPITTLTDFLLILVLPFTLAAAIIKYRTGRRSAFVSRIYMLIVFSMAALATVGYIPLDAPTRVFLLRCGWFALVFDEVVTWAKLEGWPQKLRKKIGSHH